MQLGILLNIIPVLLKFPNFLKITIGFILAVEDAIPGQGEGERKLAMLREFLEGVYGSLETVWPKIEEFVTFIVTLFNRNGVFTKEG